jgi:hypothetical protein
MAVGGRMSIFDSNYNDADLHVWYNRDGDLLESDLSDMPNLYCTTEKVSNSSGDVVIRVLNGAWDGVLNVNKGTLRIHEDLTVPVFFQFIPTVQDLTITDGTPTGSWVWTPEKLAQFHAALEIVKAGRSKDEVAFQNALDIANRNEDES